MLSLNIYISNLFGRSAFIKKKTIAIFACLFDLARIRGQTVILLICKTKNEKRRDILLNLTQLVRSPIIPPAIIFLLRHSSIRITHDRVIYGHTIDFKCTIFFFQF